MKLASLYKNKLVPSYERIRIVTKAVEEALDYFSKRELSDPSFVMGDSLPYVRRDLVMNTISKAVNDLPEEWQMSVEKRWAGGNFHYLLVRFEDLNLNLVPLHLPDQAKLPRPSGYRGDMSSFNYAVMLDHGMQEEMDFQTYLSLDQEELGLITAPAIPPDIKDIPFGLLLLYDGTNVKVPLRIAALTPGQDGYIFCDEVERLKQVEGAGDRRGAGAAAERKSRRRVRLDTATAQINEYKEAPVVALKREQQRLEK